MKAIILCAGKGERLKPLTDKTPKPMIPIAGKPLLEYLILLCKKHNIKDISINTSHLSEQIKDYFQEGKKFGVNIKYSYEPELLGTSGALNNFKDFLNETFVVVYGDEITDLNLQEMLKYHKSKGAIATLALRKKLKESKRDTIILTDNNSKLTNFTEKPTQEQLQTHSQEQNLVNSGIYVLEPEILKYIPKGFSDFAYDIFPKLIKENKEVYGFMMDNYYLREIGKIEKYELVKKEIESGQVKLNFLEQKNKAVFLDREGTINEFLYEPDGKLMAPANLQQLKILDKAKEGIQKMKELGFKIISVTNQPGVAFGYILPEKLKDINEFLKKELGIDEIYSCIHHPEYTGDCDCRKPKPGMILQAAKDFNLDISNSYMVGDNLDDIETGRKAGVKKTFRIGSLRADIIELQHQKQIFPDFTCKDLLEVANNIEKIEKNI